VVAPTITPPAAGCAGGNFVFTVPVAAGTTYEWTDNGGAASGNSYTYSGATAGTKSAQVRAVTEACQSALSSVSTVAVSVQPTINTQPAGTSVCSGTTATLSVTATNATAYQWKKGSSNVADGSGGTTANYTTAALTAGATYSVVVANGACSVTSNNALVSIKTDGCSHFTLCPGFTEVSTVSYENNTTVNWPTADSYCKNIDDNWRLPTESELVCMCSNKASLPGGYASDWYWSSELYYNDYYHTVHFGACNSSTHGTATKGTNYFMCVK
jgi:hypothetical protein